MRTLESVFLLILSSVIIAAATMVGYKVPLMDTFIGVSVLLIVGLTGFLISRLPMLNKLPSVVWISVVAIFVSSAAFPWSKEVVKLAFKVPFMAVCTPTLAYAGLSIGKDFEAFQKLSWRIVPVALAVIAGTFLCAAMIAQWALHLEGAI